MKLLVYIDTSVVGGYFDDEFEADTKLFFQRIFNKDFLVYFSEISEAELSLAPQFVRDLKEKIPIDCYRLLELNEESKKLAETYIEEKILGKACLDDAYHIAIATVNRLDVLVSWNFKHIVNYDKIKLFNSINLKFGYPMIDIRSPKEFINYENKDRKEI
jgi:predicted nucleic acid-binding protein